MADEGIMGIEESFYHYFFIKFCFSVLMFQFYFYSIVIYTNHFRFEDIANKILHVQRFKVLDFCVCDCSNLKNVAVTYSKEFKSELGSVFNDILSLNLQNAYDLIDLTSKK